MKPKLIVTGLLVSVLAALSLARLFAYQSAFAIPPTSNPSADWTVDQWTQWRDQQIAYILEPTFSSPTGDKLLSRDEIIQRSSQAYSAIQPLISFNPNLFAPGTDLGKAMTNFFAFVKGQHWMALQDSAGHPSNALGMEVSDQDYVKYAEPFTAFPDLLKSQEFLSKMSSPSGYRDAMALIEQTNASLADNRKWIVFPFRAQFIQSVDRTTYGRLLVLIPNEPATDGGTTDKWILFALATPDMAAGTEVRSVSIIAAHRHPGQARTTTTYCMDFMRIKDAVGNISPTPVVKLPFDPNHTSKNCYDCHKAAVMPIHPDTEFAFDSTGKLIEKTSGTGEIPSQINRLIRSYGPPDFGVERAEAYGPSIGPEDNPRTDAFIAAASSGSGIAVESYPKIRDAMDCASCHNGFAPINYSQAARTSRDVQAFKGGHSIIETFIEEGLMPPNNSLNAAERKALWQCLSKEYLDLQSGTGVFVSWLKGVLPDQNSFAINEAVYSNLAAMQPVNSHNNETQLRQAYVLRKKMLGSGDPRTVEAKKLLIQSLEADKNSDEIQRLFVEKHREEEKKAQSTGKINHVPVTQPSDVDLPIHGF